MENAANEILKCVEVRGRIERLIKRSEETKAECLENAEREGRKENNWPMNPIVPREKACRAERLKFMLEILHNDGVDGYANSDDQIFGWLFDCIR